MAEAEYLGCELADAFMAGNPEIYDVAFTAHKRHVYLWAEADISQDAAQAIVAKAKEAGFRQVFLTTENKTWDITDASGLGHMIKATASCDAHLYASTPAATLSTVIAEAARLKLIVNANKRTEAHPPSGRDLANLRTVSRNNERKLDL